MTIMITKKKREGASPSAAPPAAPPGGVQLGVEVKGGPKDSTAAIQTYPVRSTLRADRHRQR